MWKGSLGTQGLGGRRQEVHGAAGQVGGGTVIRHKCRGAGNLSKEPHSVFGRMTLQGSAAGLEERKSEKKARRLATVVIWVGDYCLLQTGAVRMERRWV